MVDIKLHYTNESGKYKCNYCGHDLVASTSTVRLRAHLIGEQNAGMKICLKVPDDVRISLSLRGINKRQKTATGPSNLPPVETEGMTEATTTLVLTSDSSGANNYFGNQGQENLDDVIQELLMSTQPNVPNFQAGEPSEGVERGSTHQPDPPNESCCTLEPGVGDAEMIQQEVQMVEGNREGEGSAFKRLVGEAFVKNEGKIWSWLMDDQVLRVGLYGMGGVGKTTLMRHIQTRLKGQSSFEVYWVSVSQDFSIWKLQNLIAKKIGLNFSDEEDEVDRAEKLTQSLKAKGKCILILDDLWNYFDVELIRKCNLKSCLVK